ncbi:MAG TPA: hypothetical protein ENI23_11575 [bacterium]|nr:hypothetical protein [bacterium]
MEWLRLSVLLEAMKEAGLWSSKEQIIALEKKGRLTLPRLPNKRKDRVVNEKIVIDIMDAFSPGGEGKYHYDRSTE